MRWLLLILLSWIAFGSAAADDAGTNVTAAMVLSRVQSNRVMKDFSLQGRLFVSGIQTVRVDVLVKNLPDEVRTIYRGSNSQLLVVQPMHGEPRYYVKGAGELTGDNRTQRFLGSQFSCYDLGLPFLHWPQAKLDGEDRMLGRDCSVLEVSASGEPYARVKLWIDKEYGALLRAEAYDAQDIRVRRFAITSFKKIGDVWIPRGIEISFVPKGQALPAAEKSRLEINEGNYDTQLPIGEFAPEKFGP